MASVGGSRWQNNFTVLIYILILLAEVLLADQTDEYLKREHSLSKPYGGKKWRLWTRVKD